eukprot:scaffold17375_cov74-Skeletonema_marinoi.AAC.2
MYTQQHIIHGFTIQHASFWGRLRSLPCKHHDGGSILVPKSVGKNEKYSKLHTDVRSSELSRGAYARAAVYYFNQLLP